MKTLPQSIEIQKMQLNSANIQQRTRRFASYSKKQRKSKLSKELQQGTLQALKEMLAKQKQESADKLSMSAASHLAEFFNEQQSIATNIEKIEASAQVMQLYEKLIEAIIHTDQKGIKETTLFLGDAFSSSIFQGSKITITEYSTAPKIFNIEFATNPAALSFFEAHAPEFLSALQKGNFGFSVNRLDTSLMSENEQHSIKKIERDLEKEENA